MHNGRIIIIDDDVDFVRTVREYFRDHGFEVASVTDSSVSTSLNFANFDIALIDLQMPCRSGFEVLDLLDGTHSLFVIVISGHDDLDNRIAALQHGADFFLPKPVFLEELRLVCTGALGRRSAQRDQLVEWSLFRADHRIQGPADLNLKLTTAEYIILRHIMDASPGVALKESIIDAVDATGSRKLSGEYRSIEVIISRLRKKCGDLGYILPVKALRNSGYVFHERCRVID